MVSPEQDVLENLLVAGKAVPVCLTGVLDPLTVWQAAHTVQFVGTVVHLNCSQMIVVEIVLQPVVVEAVLGLQEMIFLSLAHIVSGPSVY